MATGVHLWSQTAASNASADTSINWSEGQAPSSVNDSARAMMARVADLLKDLGGLTTAGTGTAYTVTTNRAFASSSVMDGQIIVIRPNATSGATPTLAVDGLTARNINISTGVSIPGGLLTTGTPYAVVYVHASTELILLGAVAGPAIDTLTALTAPDVADEAVIYDASAAANRKITLANFFKVIDTLTALTAPDTADELAIYDASGTAAFKITLGNLFKAIDTLTGKSAPASGDEVVIYDVSGTASKKSTLAQIATALPAFTQQKLLSGTAATYTTPTNCRAIRVRMCGAGGGGGGATANNGNTGGTTSFESWTAIGGAGGPGNTPAGALGGTGGADGTGTGFRIQGGDGIGCAGGVGGMGGASAFGGAGKAASGAAGTAGKTNSGGGGGGGNSGGSGGSGGGAGEYVEFWITSPSATYTYTVGASPSGGSAGGQAGGAGGSGIIIVDEFY